MTQEQIRSDPSQWLTTNQTAERINRTRALVSDLVRQGVLVPVFRSPGKNGPMSFDPLDVDAYIAKRDAAIDATKAN